MKILHGFALNEVIPVNEINAKLNVYEHVSSGAKLIHIERDDTNMSFAISFKTIPEDSTGVFHILEHSVLCGSDKFPLKEPFVDLLKGSLKTYLNAMTYNDKTVYPVASRNAKDFYNLVNVYMDAVFNPRATKDERIFMQEGHRFELNGNALSINGVVYNEMKGAYASCDDVAGELLSSLVLAGSCYEHDSGGNPECIPSLTYEQFKEAHAKFYHPSNSTIFLDGNVRLDEILTLLDSYLKSYTASNIDFSIDLTSPVNTKRQVYYYESTQDSFKDSTRLLLGYRAGKYDDKERLFALSVILSAMCSSNTSPFKEKFLKLGLCENLDMYLVDGIKYPYVSIELKNIKDGKENEALSAYHTLLKEFLSSGIDKAELEAALSIFEFRIRESDFGSYPKGLVYVESILSSTLYGGPADLYLSYDEVFASLRERLDTDYFTTILKEVVESDEAQLLMLPSLTISDEKATVLQTKLDNILANMTSDEKESLILKNEDFAKWQDTPDSEEAIATIPTLSISDLDPTVSKTPTQIKKIDNVTTLTHQIATGGIVYESLYFDASDVDFSDISALQLMCMMFSSSPTENGDANYMQNRIKTHTGGIGVVLSPFKNGDETKMYVAAKLSYVESKREIAHELLNEYLYTATLSDKKMLGQKLMQMKTYFEMAVCSEGTSISSLFAGAMFDPLSALRERYLGYSMLSFIRDILESFEDSCDGLIEKFRSLRDKIFVRERLTLGVTGLNVGDEELKQAIDVIRRGERVLKSVEIPLAKKENVAIEIPSDTGFSAMLCNLSEIAGAKYRGSYAVMSAIISYAILWSEVRVKCGAYGVDFMARANSGTVGASSFRDAKLDNTLSVFKNMGALLREFLEGAPDITNFIIGACGEDDPLYSPRQMGEVANTFYLSGRDHDFLTKNREQMIKTTKEELVSLSYTLDEIMKKASFTVITSKESIRKLDGLVDRIIKL